MRLYSLLKNSRFVSGYRFSDTASRSKSDAPSGAGHRNSSFSASCLAGEGATVAQKRVFQYFFGRSGTAISKLSHYPMPRHTFFPQPVQQ
jgi:hypothetical protein